MRPALLIVGQTPALRESLRSSFGPEFELLAAGDAKTALSLLRKNRVSLCVLDVRLPDGSGLDLLRQVKRFDETIEVLVITEDREVETALSAMKSGAYDYLTHPVRLETIRSAVQHLKDRQNLVRENRFLKDEAERGRDEGGFLGASPASRALSKAIASVARKQGPVLILGEPGTEKEAVARAVHRAGPVPASPFVVHRCCPRQGRDLVEGDLFGRDPSRGKGVPHPGKLEFAEDGTLYLERADHMPPEIQGRLLAFVRGDGVRVPSVRILASADPEVRAAARWNPEWKAHLSRTVLTVPPLRERTQDIPEMLERHLKRVCSLSRVPLKGLTREALQFLVHYAWPGNVRELEGTVEIMALTTDHDVLGVEDLPLDILIKQIDPKRARDDTRLSLKKARRQFERQFIRKVLERTRGNQTRAAETLGLHRNTLVWKLRELKMKEDYRLILDRRRVRKAGILVRRGSSDEPGNGRSAG